MTEICENIFRYPTVRIHVKDVLRWITLERPPDVGTRIDRCAEHILKEHVTTAGWVRESVIRTALGNTPDVSKALRRLVASKRIVRRGSGGRADPFEYCLKGRTPPFSGGATLP